MSHNEREQLGAIHVAVKKKCVTRRVISMICALSCLLGLSVAAFAGTSFKPADTTKWTDTIDGKESTVFGIFPTSKCTEEQKLFLREWVNSDRRMLIHSGVSSYEFALYDGTFIAETISLIGESLNIKFSSSGTYRCLFFRGSDKSMMDIQSFRSPTVIDKVIFDSSKTILIDDFFYTATTDLPQTTIDKYYEDIEDQVVLMDDSDIFGSADPPPTPSEPEPPPTSTPDPPKLPDVPAGDGNYVVYNTSVWKIFMNAIRTNIGNAVVTGFIILAALLGIYLVIRIIKSFAHT